MKGISRFLANASLALFLIHFFVLAAYPADTDTEKQQALQKELEHSLVAPCCWNMTVDQHESGAARQVRAEISDLLKQGKAKDDILQAMVAEYGERILATPDQGNFMGKLAYWLIPVSVVLGLILVGKKIRRFAQPVSGDESKQTTSPASEEGHSEWDIRVEEELKNLD